MKSIIIRIMAAVLLVALTVSMAACAASKGDTETPTQTETEPQTTAPTTDAFVPPTTLNCTVLDGNGNKVKISDLYGTPIVLNFWASWCPPCKSELPDFEEAYKKYEGKVTFLMVNVTDNQRETVEVAKGFVESQGYTFPVYFDTGYEASYAYGIQSIPQTFFLDAEGNVVAKYTGLISGSKLEGGIGMIYGE